MRGGQPGAQFLAWLKKRFSLHARGSTPQKNRRCLGQAFHPACAGVNLFDARGKHTFDILPACAGINLVLVDFVDLDIYLPRMRGGQPDFVVDAYTTLFFPLHMQGCSFFTTQNCLEEIT